MSRVTLFPFAAATLLVLAAGAGPARAQAPDGLIIRSFVSAGGNDANGCTRPAPCRTLSAALAKTAAGGTISIVDAGGYGTVTIDKTISIVNDGAGTASILVPQGEIGVFVKDPFYEARVHLRGLTIEGANVGSTGVFVNGARAVSVENCVIRNLFGGILFGPESSNVASNKPFMAQSALTVANTTIADIGGVAVLIVPGDIGGAVKATLRGVRVFNNSEMGIQVLGGASRQPIDVAISDSLVTQNGRGIVANTNTAQAPVKVMVTGSTVAHSFFTGLEASASPPDPGQQDIKSTAEIWIGQSTVFGNTTGVQASGGALVRSFGDNYIAGNQSDGTFTATARR
jgi:parallel beta helix pectate lyase-like protein